MKLVKLDARRLLCPMPVIKAQNAIKELQSGDVLEITCTDPGVVQDIPMWTRINGHHLLSVCETDNEIVIQIKVNDASS